MKKLLVLALVLGLASVASAALTWSVSSVSVGLNESATVQISSSTATTYAGGPAWVGNDASTVAEITGISALAAAGGNAAIQDPTATTWAGWWTVNALDTEEPFTIASGNQWDVTIKGLAVGSYVIGSDFYASAGANDSLTITVIPEPMTIALLGLGGLFLRRRK